MCDYTEAIKYYTETEERRCGSNKSRCMRETSQATP